MKILSKKTEMAEAINFGKYPVLTIELYKKSKTYRDIQEYNGEEE